MKFKGAKLSAKHMHEMKDTGGKVQPIQTTDAK